MKKRVTYRPSKASAAIGLVVGILFVFLGVTVLIPETLRSGFLPATLFGLVWTGAAVATTVGNARYLFGKRKDPSFFGGVEITEEEPEGFAASFRSDAPDHQHITASGMSPKVRLEQLETLKEAGLLTREEYEAKRAEILREL